MKELILEGISVVLGETGKSGRSSAALGGKDLLLEFSGKVALDIPDGSERHDLYIESADRDRI